MTERSARSGITVVSWLAALLAMFGSLVAVVATAWLVIVPGELGVMRMVSTTEPPELIEPSWQASSGKAMPHEPWLMVAKLKLAPAGIVSVSSTVCAVSGPWFTIVTV